MFLKFHFKLIVIFSHIHKTVLLATGGRLMQRLGGLDMLLLTTIGRKTGNLRSTPLLYIEHGGEYYCAASFAGNDRNPEWFLNLVSDPHVELLVRNKRFPAEAHLISGQERIKAWGKLVNYHSDFAIYQRRTERAIPVIKFSPICK